MGSFEKNSQRFRIYNNCLMVFQQEYTKPYGQSQSYFSVLDKIVDFLEKKRERGWGVMRGLPLLDPGS
jgi:hypothetical protein